MNIILENKRRNNRVNGVKCRNTEIFVIDKSSYFFSPSSRRNGSNDSGAFIL